MTDRPLISLVMIVKNEAAILRETLELLRGLVDEWVIVDTGSTDGTQAIIAGYGPLHELPFEDFVTTKNKALSLATGAYILLMDADERLIAGREKLRALAESGAYDGVKGLIVEGPSPDQVTMQYERFRMWRNNGAWRFVGPGVHEVIATPTGAVVAEARDVVVWHDHRHRDAESFVRRSQMYVALLQRALERDARDSRAAFYLARTYRDMGLWLEAIAAYRYFLEIGTWTEERWQAWYDMALCWIELGEWEHAREACARALREDGRRAEVWTLLGRLNYQAQEWGAAVANLARAVTAPIPAVALFLDPREYREAAADMLALSLFRAGEYGEALKWGERALEWAGKAATDRMRDNVWWYRRRARRTWFFMLGRTPEPVYGSMLDEIGAGGVETTYIELPKALRQLGQECYVFCQCEHEHESDGVVFAPWGKLEEYADLRPDVLVASRWFEPLYWDWGDARRIVWLQDAYFANPGRALDVADRIVVSSQWHRDYTVQRYGHGVDAGKLRVIGLGIRRSLFAREGRETAERERRERGERRERQVIYSSNPDRGLQELAEMWPDIVAGVGPLTLVVTYGWQGLRTWDGSAEWQERCRRVEEGIREKLQGDDVVFTGRLGKRRLAEVMMASTVCLYPCNFFETFCLTALECQAAGLPMVTSALGALSTTIAPGAGVLVPGHPKMRGYRERFVPEAVALLKDGEARERMGRAGLAYVASAGVDWADVAARWVKLEREL